MLKTRLLTAAVALPLAVAAIIWLPTAAVAAILALILAAGAWEWGRLAGLTTPASRGLFVLAGLLLFWALWYPSTPALLAWLVLLAAALWWAAAVPVIAAFPRACPRGFDICSGSLPVSLSLGLLLLAAPFAALVGLHGCEQGAALMLLFFAIVWVADSGAYFAGRGWGRHKLAVRVSPGKTWEGAFGGAALALVTAGLGGWAVGFGGAHWLAFVLLGGLTAAVSVVGDLAFSMFKRQARVKDSGRLFPGHGGVLDRLDSMLAAAPIFVIGLTLIAR